MTVYCRPVSTPPGGGSKRPYASMNVTPAARDSLQRLSLRASADVGRRLTLSEVIMGAVRLAGQHQEEFLRLIMEGES